MTGAHCPACGSTLHHISACPHESAGYPEPTPCETCGDRFERCDCYARAIKALKRVQAEDSDERRELAAWGQLMADADLRGL